MLNIIFDGSCEYEQKTGKEKINIPFWLNSSKLIKQYKSNSYKISVLRHYNLVGVFCCVKNENDYQKCFVYVNNDTDEEAIKLSQYLLEKIKTISLEVMN